jgi:hypothetical protein
LQHVVERSVKKQELEVILGDGENTPDLGPIEDYLHAVATERKLPAFAVGMCTLRIEEAAPKLRAVLARAAEGKELSDDESLCYSADFTSWAVRVTAKRASRCCACCAAVR